MSVPKSNLGKSGVFRTHATDDFAEIIACEIGEAALLSRRSPYKDTDNEDAAIIVPIGNRGLLLAVADGCGGMPAGDEAARKALTALRSEVLNQSVTDFTGAVMAGFDAANQAVLDMRVGAGTTLAVVIIIDNEARMFHVGDSLALVTGQRGVVRLQAIAHSPTGFGVEAGLMTEEEAIAHEHRNLVLNIVGSSQMSVEISQKVKLRPRDTVLLSSDGLSDNVMTDQIVQKCRVGSCLKAVETLAEIATKQMHTQDGHPDDLTILAYRPTPHRSS